MIHIRRLSCKKTQFLSVFCYVQLAKLPVQADWCGLSKGSRNLNNISFRSNKPVQYFSTMSGTILVQARDLGRLSEDLEYAIEEGKLYDAWSLHEKHLQLEGFPRKSVVNKLLISCAESFDLHWLEKVYELIERAFEEHKHKLFDRETLIFVSLGLARCGLPVEASTLLRKLVEMELYPPVNAWSAILAYMSQIDSGAYLAAELVLEIGYLFQDGRVDPRKKINEPLIAMKPNTTAFNIALAGCLLFEKTRKAEQLLDMMPRVSVKLDTTSLIIMAHIYERNGRREELKKLKRNFDEAYDVSLSQFQQFSNCLLSCHLKFGDLESASLMVLEMLCKAKQAHNSLAVANLSVEVCSPSLTIGGSREDINNKKLDLLGTDKRGSGVSKASMSNEILSLSFVKCCRDRKFSTLESEAKRLLHVLTAKLHDQIELITSEYGILQPSEIVYVRLVKAFLEAERTKELVEFLLKAEKEGFPMSADDCALVHVINACVSLKWLDQAYDILDELRLAGVRMSSSVYASLLKAYCKENKAVEVNSLLRDAQRAGVQLDGSCYDALIQLRVLEKDTGGALTLFKEMKEAKLPRAGHQEFEMLVRRCTDDTNAGLMGKLLQEIQDGQRVDYGVHDWNNVIHFFCKKRLMQDAEKALKKMISLDLVPNAQTFHSLVTGYAAIGGKYIEVTELWGEMKALGYSTGMKFDQELLDAVLYTFVRGGFFIRANEVVEMMEKGNMFIDKYKYRVLFLKYHKTLYKGKTPKFQTESHFKKRESVLTFKTWVGLS
ncbi:hypothetical protein Leryth_018590 [Lithospermum erythrorhizon]|nr:hypothetical protein Leryth_018590 [Lithospermum erythrorhizon]